HALRVRGSDGAGRRVEGGLRGLAAVRPREPGAAALAARHPDSRPGPGGRRAGRSRNALPRGSGPALRRGCPVPPSGRRTVPRLGRLRGRRRRALGADGRTGRGDAAPPPPGLPPPPRAPPRPPPP